MSMNELLASWLLVGVDYTGLIDTIVAGVFTDSF
jgi:hypothetical protein